MGIQAVAKKAARVAFKAAGDAVALVNYRTKTQGAYDPVLDKQAEVIVDTEIKLMFDTASLDGSKRNTVDDFLSGKRTALMLSEDLPVPPKTDDYIYQNGVNARTYVILGIKPGDPLPEPVTWVLLLELQK